MTYNRALLENNSQNHLKEVVFNHRIDNYHGRTNTAFENIEQATFQGVAFDQNGGYKGKGGYVFYFADNLSYQEASTQFDNLSDDSLGENRMFGNKFLAITIEILLFNPNYQVGVSVALEFLENNAGFIDKTLTSNAFYVSKYNTDFHQYSESLITFLKA